MEPRGADDYPPVRPTPRGSQGSPGLPL